MTSVDFDEDDYTSVDFDEDDYDKCCTSVLIDFDEDDYTSVAPQWHLSL